jgi:hypothetical protein
VAALLPDLKRRALAADDGGRPPTPPGPVGHDGGRPPNPPGPAGRPEGPASLQTATLVVGYSVTRDEGVWVHYVSVSSAVTPARAAGTFFLGLVRGVLGLEGPPAEVFVSQNQVFHLIVRLSDEEQKVFADRPVAAAAPTELRRLAIAGRAALLPRLVERTMPPGGALVKEAR